MEGERPPRLFPLPTFLRRDGLILRIGAMVTIKHNSETRYCIKDIFITYRNEEVNEKKIDVTLRAHPVLEFPINAPI